MTEADFHQGASIRWLVSTPPRRIATAIGSALLISLVTSAQANALLALRGETPPFREIFARHASLWLLWPPFAFLICAVWNWTRLRFSAPLHWATHALLSVLVAVLAGYVMLHVALASQDVVAIPPEFLMQAGVAFPRLLIPGLVLYWAVCGGSALFRSLETIRVQKEQVALAEQRAIALRANLDSARFQLLQRQIHPHFLFNSLNAVVGLLRQGQVEASCDVVVSLSSLLRATLRASEDDLVPLAQDLDLAERYLLIQKARFGERLRVHRKDLGKPGTAKLPPLTVLTLVENSVEHALAATEGTIDLSIRATQGKNFARLVVEDSGPGFPEDVLQDTRVGIGLRNSRDRLRLAFGKNQGFRISNRSDGGAVVEIEIPHGDPMSPDESGSEPGRRNPAPTQAEIHLP